MKSRASENFDYIHARASAGVPVSHIARMIGCNVADVELVLSGTPKLVQQERKPVLLIRGPHVDAPIKVKKATRSRAVARRAVIAAERKARARPMPKRALEVVERVSSRRNVDLELLLSHRLFKGATLARHEAFHELYSTGLYSFPLIGSWFGGLDHTSVMHGVRMHVARMQKDVDRWDALGAKAA